MAEVKPGTGRYKVVGGVAVVRTLDGSEKYVYKNGTFNAVQADAKSVGHLLSVGLIEEIKTEAKPEPKRPGRPPKAEGTQPE